MADIIKDLEQQIDEQNQKIEAYEKVSVNYNTLFVFKINLKKRASF